jgi:TolA-binding protein
VAFLLVVIAISVGTAALVYIFTKNQTYALGRQQTAVEREIVELEEEIRSLNMKVGEALSRKNLTDRLTSQRSKLKNIQPGSIIKVTPAAPQPGGTDAGAHSPALPPQAEAPPAP